MKGSSIFLLCVILMTALFSCRAVKDRKAVGRILGDPALTEKVYSVAVGLHPSMPETVYIKGKDSITEIHYPEYMPADGAGLALTTTIYKLRVDTLIKEDTSTRRRLDYALQQNYTMGGRIQELNTTITRQAGEIKSGRTRILVVGLGGIIIIAGLLFLLFRPKIRVG